MHRIGNRRVMVARQLVIFKLSQYKSNKFIPIRDYVKGKAAMIIYMLGVQGKDAQLLNVRFASTPIFITEIVDCHVQNSLNFLENISYYEEAFV